ncbi:MAG: hypothetical protein [Circular genetic element sp.]|nr:MAG: hypothetical protein [Circular genetic element sp.]
MKKYNLSNIMKRAWEIKKENEERFLGQKVLFASCLKMAWIEVKSEKMRKVLCGMGFRVWTGGKEKRIYIDGLDSFKKTGLLEKYARDWTQYRIAQIYFDMNTLEFVKNRKACGANGMNDIIEELENMAYNA